MTRREVYADDFDVGEATMKINSLMSRWSAHMIMIKGRNWQVFNHSDEVIYEFNFSVDFMNIDTRIKLEDLRLNVIHHIESMRDDTVYIDELVDEKLILD